MHGAIAPAALMQSVKNVSDELQIMQLERDVACAERDDAYKTLGREQERLDVERSHMLQIIDSMQAQLDAAGGKAAVALAKVGEQHKFHVAGLQADMMSANNAADLREQQLKNNIKRMREQMAELSRDFDQSSDMANEASNREKDALLHDITRLETLVSDVVADRDGIRQQGAKYQAKVAKLLNIVKRHNEDQGSSKGEVAKVESELADRTAALAVCTSTLTAERDEGARVQQQLREYAAKAETQALAADRAKEAMAERALDAESTVGDLLRENQRLRDEKVGAAHDMAAVETELAGRSKEIEDRDQATERLKRKLTEASAISASRLTDAATEKQELALVAAKVTERVGALEQQLASSEATVAALRAELAEVKAAAKSAEVDLSREQKLAKLAWTQSLGEQEALVGQLRQQLEAKTAAHAAVEEELLDHRPKIKELELALLAAENKANSASDQLIQDQTANDIELLDLTRTLHEQLDETQSSLMAAEAHRDSLLLRVGELELEVGLQAQSLEAAAAADTAHLKLEAGLREDAAAAATAAAAAAEEAEEARLLELETQATNLRMETRVKEEALYGLVLELSTKLQRIQPNADHAAPPLDSAGRLPPDQMDAGKGRLLDRDEEAFDDRPAADFALNTSES